MDIEPEELKQTNRNGPAADTALKLMKQLITLSSGVLVLSATFIGNFSTASALLLIVLVVAWVLLTIAVLAGLETISAIVKSRLFPEHDWSRGRGQTTARFSKYCFVTGLAFFAIFAFLTLFTACTNEGQPSTSDVSETRNSGAIEKESRDQVHFLAVDERFFVL